jgi:hypothetical protein
LKVSHAGRYRKGRKLEYKVRDWLKTQGYRHFLRSSGSHSPIDLAAFGSKRRPLFIQVKTGSYISDAEVKALEQFARDSDSPVFIVFCRGSVDKWVWVSYNYGNVYNWWSVKIISVMKSVGGFSWKKDHGLRSSYGFNRREK